MFVLFIQCFGSESRFSVSPSQPKVGFSEFSFKTEKNEKSTFGFEEKKNEPTEPTVSFAAACRSKSSTFAQA